MIMFYNDNLVSPVLCEILYHTVPEELHRPVVFKQRDYEHSYPAGRYCSKNGWAERIEIFLNPHVGRNVIDYSERIYGTTSFKVWYSLLHTCYHEFGHVADPWDDEEPALAYIKTLSAYERAEGFANHWANNMIWQLAERDGRLYQPKWLGYLSIRISKLFEWTKGWSFRPQTWEWTQDNTNESVGCCNRQKWMWLKDWRGTKTGGQMTVTDVGINLGLFRGPGHWQYHKHRNAIKRVASDLARVHIDSAGRRHMYFAFGDLPEIQRRLETIPRFKRSCSCENKVATQQDDEKVIIHEDESGSIWF